MGFVPEWGILLAGDAAEPPLPYLNPGSPAGTWAEALEIWAGKLEGTPDGPPLVIPSHGEPGGTEILLANARYLRTLAEGGEPEVPENLSSFYRETHAANLALIRSGQGG